MEKSTRRAFLKTGLAGLIGVSALGSLGGCTEELTNNYSQSTTRFDKYIETLNYKARNSEEVKDVIKQYKSIDFNNLSPEDKATLEELKSKKITKNDLEKVHEMFPWVDPNDPKSFNNRDKIYLYKIGNALTHLQPE
jgi:hypothetical protein